MPIRLQNIDLAVSDMARSLGFYTTLFQMTNTPQSAPPYMMILDAGGVSLSLHQTGTPGGRPVNPGSVELAFACDDLPATHAHFLEHGVSVGPIQQFGFGSSFEATDPDGYHLNLYTLRETSAES